MTNKHRALAPSYVVAAICFAVSPWLGDIAWSIGTVVFAAVFLAIYIRERRKGKV